MAKRITPEEQKIIDGLRQSKGQSLEQTKRNLERQLSRPSGPRPVDSGTVIRTESVLPVECYDSSYEPLFMGDESVFGITCRNACVDILNEQATGQVYLGDLNLDGQLNVSDLLQIVDLILGNTPPGFEGTLGTCKRWLADITQDGFVNIQDVLARVNFILSGQTPESAGIPVEQVAGELPPDPFDTLIACGDPDACNFIHQSNDCPPGGLYFLEPYTIEGTLKADGYNLAGRPCCHVSLDGVPDNSCPDPNLYNNAYCIYPCDKMNVNESYQTKDSGFISWHNPSFTSNLDSLMEFHFYFNDQDIIYKQWDFDCRCGWFRGNYLDVGNGNEFAQTYGVTSELSGNLIAGVFLEPYSCVSDEDQNGFPAYQTYCVGSMHHGCPLPSSEGWQTSYYQGGLFEFGLNQFHCLNANKSGCIRDDDGDGLAGDGDWMEDNTDCCVIPGCPDPDATNYCPSDPNWEIGDDPLNLAPNTCNADCECYYRVEGQRGATWCCEREIPVEVCDCPLIYEGNQVVGMDPTSPGCPNSEGNCVPGNVSCCPDILEKLVVGCDPRLNGNSECHPEASARYSEYYGFEVCITYPGFMHGCTKDWYDVEINLPGYSKGANTCGPGFCYNQEEIDIHDDECCGTFVPPGTMNFFSYGCTDPEAANYGHVNPYEPILRSHGIYSIFTPNCYDDISGVISGYEPFTDPNYIGPIIQKPDFNNDGVPDFTLMSYENLINPATNEPFDSCCVPVLPHVDCEGEPGGGKEWDNCGRCLLPTDPDFCNALSPDWIITTDDFEHASTPGRDCAGNCVCDNDVDVHEFICTDNDWKTADPNYQGIEVTFYNAQYGYYPSIRYDCHPQGTPKPVTCNDGERVCSCEDCYRVFGNGTGVNFNASPFCAAIDQDGDNIIDVDLYNTLDEETPIDDVIGEEACDGGISIPCCGPGCNTYSAVINMPQYYDENTGRTYNYDFNLSEFYCSCAPDCCVYNDCCPDYVINGGCDECPPIDDDIDDDVDDDEDDFDDDVQPGETYGCMDESACNYDADATIDDGSCIGPSVRCRDGLNDYLICPGDECPCYTAIISCNPSVDDVNNNFDTTYAWALFKQDGEMMAEGFCSPEGTQSPYDSFGDRDMNRVCLTKQGYTPNDWFEQIFSSRDASDINNGYGYLGLEAASYMMFYTNDGLGWSTSTSNNMTIQPQRLASPPYYVDFDLLPSNNFVDATNEEPVSLLFNIPASFPLGYNEDFKASEYAFYGCIPGSLLPTGNFGMCPGCDADYGQFNKPAYNCETEADYVNYPDFDFDLDDGDGLTYQWCDCLSPYELQQLGYQDPADQDVLLADGYQQCSYSLSLTPYNNPFQDFNDATLDNGSPYCACSDIQYGFDDNFDPIYDWATYWTDIDNNMQYNEIICGY